MADIAASDINLPYAIEGAAGIEPINELAAMNIPDVYMPVVS